MVELRKARSGNEAHVCFINAEGVIRGTSPTNDGEFLATAYYREALADWCKPRNVRWYIYDYWPSTGISTLLLYAVVWRQNRFVRSEAPWPDTFYESVPRIIGCSMLATENPDTPVRDLITRL